MSCENAGEVAKPKNTATHTKADFFMGILSSKVG
jgi:hypothetical protein